MSAPSVTPATEPAVARAPVLQARGVTKRFAGITALNEVAIGHEGEVRAFVEGRDEFETLPSAAALAAPAGGSE